MSEFERAMWEGAKICGKCFHTINLAVLKRSDERGAGFFFSSLY